MAEARIIMGIDPGLAHTGWGVVQQKGTSLSCVAYGCVATQPTMSLHQRLAKIYTQISAVVLRYKPECVAVETVWFGSNAQSAFATGQARGAALTACGKRQWRLPSILPARSNWLLWGQGPPIKVKFNIWFNSCWVWKKPPRPTMLPMLWRPLSVTPLIRFLGKGGLCGDFVFAGNDRGAVR